MIELNNLAIADIKVIKTKQFIDHRGYFSETYNEVEFARVGVDLHFVQDNQSMSSKAGTVRGLHYQSHPMAQDKLVRVIRGRIFDVVVDIRRSSRTFGKWVSIELTASDGNQLLVPKGFAHGFCTLEPHTEVMYKVSNYYSPSHDFGLLWSDPDISVDWPITNGEAILSDKDKMLPRLREASHLFD